MPMAAQVRLVVGYDHDMKGSGRDLIVAPRALILLAGCIWLDRRDRHPQIAHASRPMMTTRVAATRTRSRASLRAGRKGLKPTRQRYRPPLASREMSWLHSLDDDAVRTLTLDRPERKNAVPPGGWRDLTAAFSDFERSGQRVLILTGNGGSFCSGADLDPEGVDRNVVATRRRMKMVGEAALTLHRLSKPTIALVDGVAAGAGMNLALGCDLVVATPRARFSEVFPKRGLTVDFGGTWLLPRVVGLQRAKELALTGRMVEADEALAIGLVYDLWQPAEVETRLSQLTSALIAGAPMAQMFTKQSLNRAFSMSFAQALEDEGQSQAICLASEDAVEGVAAFFEKRPPRFRGR